MKENRQTKKAINEAAETTWEEIKMVWDMSGWPGAKKRMDLH